MHPFSHGAILLCRRKSESGAVSSVRPTLLKAREATMVSLTLYLLHGLSTILAPPVADEPTAVIPDDPLWSRQISYLNPGGSIAFDNASWRASERTFNCVRGIDLNLTRAWSITTGSSDVVVAILDDGFFYDHEDIRENIWRNLGETGVDEKGYDRRFNGVDDDNNGYVDDVMGWDFRFGDPDPDCYIFDGMDATRVQHYNHSMPAMGIIGAKGDNCIGVAGINWDVSMMLLKIGAQGIKPPKRFAMRRTTGPRSSTGVGSSTIPTLTPWPPSKRPSRTRASGACCSCLRPATTRPISISMKTASIPSVSIWRTFSMSRRSTFAGDWIARRVAIA
jgi:subtilisin family serine protease